MKLLKFALATGIALTAAPAFAQDSDTIKTIVEKGSKLEVMDMAFEFTYKADGTYADNQGTGGKYRVDGKKLCLTPDALGQELCSEYPDGKKSGDSFEITSDFGPMKVTIK